LVTHALPHLIAGAVQEKVQALFEQWAIPPAGGVQSESAQQA
jgi:hypothetical protein